MSHVTYKIVEHDGGWAYTVDGVFRKLPTHAAALAAAKRAAAEQRVPRPHRGDRIRTSDGKWHTETAAAATVRIPTCRTRPDIPRSAAASRKFLRMEAVPISERRTTHARVRFKRPGKAAAFGETAS